MPKNAAEVLIDTIYDWGVEVIFGIPGDGINGIMEALRQRQNDIRFIQVRHEESAASWPADTPNSRAAWVSASQRRVQVEFTSSTGFMTRSLMEPRCWRSPDCNFMTWFTPSPSKTWNSISCSWTFVATTLASWL